MTHSRRHPPVTTPDDPRARGDCYRQAVLALLAGPEDLSTAYYVEGVAVCRLTIGLLAVAHGWVERADGRVYDAEWPAENGAAYFPIQRWTYDEMMRLVGRHTTLTLPLLGDLDSPSYQQHPQTRLAWQQARVFVRANYDVRSDSDE